MNWAEKFNEWRNTIEAAETPFAKFAILILTPLAALIPSVLTSMHMYKLFLQMFEFNGGKYLAAALSFVIGVVLELLGYVGALQLIKAVYDVIRKGRDEYLVPVVLNLLVYVFYLFGIYQINVALARYFEIPEIFSRIIGLLAFITVPTGILAANHLSLKENKEEEIEERNFISDQKLKAKAIRKGINIFAEGQTTTYPSEVKSVSKQKSDWRQLTPQEQHEAKHVLTPKELLEKYDIGRATAYAWKTDKYKVG